MALSELIKVFVVCLKLECIVKDTSKTLEIFGYHFMICPKFVVLNPLKDRPACKSIDTDKNSLTEPEPLSNEECQWQKERMYGFKIFFKRGFKDSHDFPGHI